MDHYKSSLFNTLMIKTLVLLFVSSAAARAEIVPAPEIMLSAPQLLEVGVQAYCTNGTMFCRDNLRYFVEGGYLWAPFSNSNQIKLFSFETGARYFPWKSPFYISLGIGFRNAVVSLNISSLQFSGDNIATNTLVRLSTLYAFPKIGLEFQLGKRTFLGIDAGIQFPFAMGGDLLVEDQSTGLTSSTSDQLRTNSNQAIGRIAGLILPAVTLLRFGWFFD